MEVVKVGFMIVYARLLKSCALVCLLSSMAVSLIHAEGSIVAQSIDAFDAAAAADEMASAAEDAKTLALPDTLAAAHDSFDDDFADLLDKDFAAFDEFSDEESDDLGLPFSVAPSAGASAAS